jgi:hypothetical protein
MIRMFTRFLSRIRPRGRGRDNPLLSQVATNVSFARTAIEIIPTSVGYEIRVEQVLESRGIGSTLPFVLDLSTCPFLLHSISCSSSTRPTQDGSLLFFNLAAGYSWNGSEVRYKLRWNTVEPRDVIDQSPIINFPEMLPTPVSISLDANFNSAFPQQKIVCYADELASDISFVGLAATAVEEGTGSDLIELAICGVQSKYQTIPNGQYTILISNALEATIGQESVANLVRSIHVGCDYLTDHLGERGARAVIVCLGSELPESLAPQGGIVIPLSEEDLERYPVGSNGFQVELIRELAHMWWGQGCRIVGNGGKDLEMSIGGAMSLMWSEAIADPNHSRTLANYHKAASSSDPREPGGQTVPDLALDLYGALRCRPDRPVKALLSDLWGLYVPVELADRELSAIRGKS